MAKFFFGASIVLATFSCVAASHAEPNLGVGIVLTTLTAAMALITAPEALGLDK